MKEILLTKGKVTLVDDEDFEYLSQWRWQAEEASYTWYAHRTIRKEGAHTTIQMHRLIMNTPVHMQIDHKDGDGLNNQKSNLRFCNRTQNQMNRTKQKNNKSGYKGIYWDESRKRWRVAIKVDGKIIRLGDFIDRIDAAKWYDSNALKYFGEFARLNFPRKEVS